MGILEKELAAKIYRTKINSAIISTVAITGGLAVALLAPNVVGILGKTFLKQYDKRFQSSLRKLVDAGYIVFEEVEGVKKLQLTKKGEWFAAQIGKGSLVPKKPKKWDQKWRMIIFDISEKRKKSRAQIRLALTNLGFYRLQDSVWVYPYDCEEFITVLKIDMKLRNEVLYVIADKIENDGKIRVHFGLK